jgi:tyrosyl-tRNA synthetase
MPTTFEMMNVWTITKSEAQGISVIKLVRLLKFAASNSEARRLVRQRAVRLNDVVIEDENAVLTLKTQDVFHVGKRRFAGIMVAND